LFYVILNIDKIILNDNTMEKNEIIISNINNEFFNFINFKNLETYY